MSIGFSPNRRTVAFGLPALGALTFAWPRFAGAAIDARNVDPMRLKLVDWLSLGGGDRDIFITGFSVGWHWNIDPESDAVRRGPVNKLLDALDLQFTKLANQPHTAYVPLTAVLARATLVGWLPPIEMLGAEWNDLQMRHRILALQTIVAGAHSEAVWQALGRPQDGDRLIAALANPRRFARSPLPLNPNLMLTRLLDYYADEAHLETPVTKAILMVDRRHRNVSNAADASPPAAPDS